MKQVIILLLILRLRFRVHRSIRRAIRIIVICRLKKETNKIYTTTIKLTLNGKKKWLLFYLLDRKLTTTDGGSRPCGHSYAFDLSKNGQAAYGNNDTTRRLHKDFWSSDWWSGDSWLINVGISPPLTPVYQPNGITDEQ